MSPVPSEAPLIVGIGGTTRPGSSSERVLARALEAVEALGARTRMFTGPFLARMPIYDPAVGEPGPEAAELLATVAAADGVIISTPGYHGSISGLIKNAVDTLEGLRTDARPYLENRSVGCVVVADGWQACGTALSALRTIVHALRGWPTPMGLTFNPSATPLFDGEGRMANAKDIQQVELLASQVVEFARRAR